MNVTGWPAWMLPTSASFTEAHTCIRRRSLAIRNKLGALMADTTVCPAFIRRAMIVPFTGERIVQ